MADDRPEIHDNAARKRFEIDLGDGRFAFAAYTMLPGAIRFYHTEVPEDHEGKGLGTSLVKAGLSAARAQGLKVIPSCPFFLSYLKKHPEEQDLIHPDQRELLDD